MFRNKRTKILFCSQEEETVLEVLPQEPQFEQIVALKQAKVTSNLEESYFGKIVDYDGRIYEFEWDNSRQKLVRLVGSTVKPFVWSQATELLEEVFKVEKNSNLEELEEVILSSTNKVIGTVNSGLKHLDSKVEKALSKPEVPVVQARPQPQLERPVQKQQPALELEEAVADPNEEQIFLNAQRFLSESREDKLDLDYLSL